MSESPTEVLPLPIREVRTFVAARDFSISLAFYEALGWKVEWTDGKLALMANAGLRFYLQDAYLKEWAENSMLHITVDDAEAWYQRATEILDGGRFGDARVAPPKKEPYGALVTYVWDPAGVLLHFAQWLDR